MKQVTIDNVRERIAELEMVNSHGELSLRGEFELACLRMLAASLERIAELEEIDREQMAELYRRNATIHRLQQQLAVQAVPNEMPEPDTARMFFTDAVVAIAKVQGWNACRAKIIGNMLLADMDSAATRKVQELTTCNTAQQFEALATRAGSGKP